MSEENKVNVNQGQKNEPMQSLLNVTEHEDFNSIVGVKYLSANEFCEIVSSMFKVVFGDYEGCVLSGVPQSNQIEVLLYFNHDPRNESKDMPLCCSKDIDADGTKNPMLAGYRRYNNRVINGDRYFVTEEGKATLTPLLIENRNLLNRNGNIDWGKICSEVSTNANQFMFDPTKQQYTQISYLDPVKLAELIYGTEYTDSEGNVCKWVYDVKVRSSMPRVALNSNPNDPMGWMLGIERISEKEVFELAKKYGLSVSTGLNIVR